MRTGYGRDLRERAVENLEKGMTYKEVSLLFKVNISTLQQWKKLKSAGDICPKREDKRLRPKLDRESIVNYINDNSDLYLYEIAKKFNTVQSVIHYICKKFGLTRKKNLKLQRSKRSGARKVLG